MQKSTKSDWELIWDNINDNQGYAYQKSRDNRVMDKIDLFCSKDVKFQENQKILENTLYKMIHEYTYHEIQSA